MAEGQGQENDDSSEQCPNQMNDLNEMMLNLANGEMNIDSMVHAYAQEYETLDQTMDELDGWMNKIEEQNDTLNAQLDDLLQSSKEARRELQEQNLQEQNLQEQKLQDETLQEKKGCAIATQGVSVSSDNKTPEHSELEQSSGCAEETVSKHNSEELMESTVKESSTNSADTKTEH